MNCSLQKYPLLLSTCLFFFQDLVPKMLAVNGNGQKVEFLTTDRVLTKFFNRFIKGEKSKCIIFVVAAYGP